MTFGKPELRSLGKNFGDYTQISRTISILRNYTKVIDFRLYVEDQICFFMYSCRAFSNSSLTFRADPVFATTNCIHSFQTCLSILIDVLAFFTFSWLNSHELPFTVNKDSGNYHNINIEFHGIMVLWYNGNNVEFRMHKRSQVSEQEDTTVR